MQPRLRRAARHGADADQGGRDAASAALSWGERRAAARPTRRRTSGWSGPRTTGSTGSPAARFPDHPWRTLPAAQRADAQGPDLRADRRDGRRRHDVAARDARRRAQLGLPLHLDPRRHLRAVGPLHARLRLGGRTTSSTSSPTSPRPSDDAADHVRHRRRARAARVDARPPLGYEGARPVRIGNGAYRQHQHDVWGAMLDSVYLHTRSRDRLDERIWPILVTQVEAALAHWREPDRGIWEVRGEPQHFTSSKVMCWVARRSRRAAGAAARRPRARRALAGGRRRDPRRHLRARRRRARRLHPALRHRRARRVAAADAARALPAAPTTSGSARPCWRSPTS